MYHDKSSILIHIIMYLKSVCKTQKATNLQSSPNVKISEMPVFDKLCVLSRCKVI